MKERNVVRFAVSLTVILAVFVVGFTLGRRPERSGIVLVESVDVTETGEQLPKSEPSEGETSETQNQESESVSGLPEGFPIDLNSATIEELVLVPGIGEATAEKILEYRKIAGSFENVDELLNVSGIGEKKLEDMREYFRVE